MSRIRMSSLASAFELIMPKPSDVNTITEKLNNLFPQLQLNPSDIQRPTAELMCDVYQLITQYIMDIPDAIYMTPPLAPNSFCGTEMFTQACSKLVIFQALSAIVEDISSNEIQFSYLDLVAPEPTSTRVLLSALLSFIEFTAAASAKAQEIFNSVDSRKGELECKKRSVIELSNEKQRMVSDANNRKRMENELREKMEILEYGIKETYAEAEEFGAELKTINKSNIELGKKLEELQGEGKRLTYQIEVADRDIVNSPHRLQAELNELTKLLENVEKEISIDRRKNWEYREKQKERVLATKTIEHIAEVLKKLNERQKECTASEERVAEAIEQLNIAGDDCEHIETKLVRENQKLQTMDEELEKDEMLHIKSIDDMKEYLTTLNEQVKDIRRRMQDTDKENIEVQREIGKVKNEIATLNRTSSANIRNLAFAVEEALNKYLEAEKAFEENYKKMDDLKNLLTAILNKTSGDASCSAITVCEVLDE